MKRLHLRRGEASVRGSGSSPAQGFDRSIGANLPNRMLPNLIPEGQKEQKGADSISGVGSGVPNRLTTGMDSHESLGSLGAHLHRMFSNLVPEGQREQKGAYNIIDLGSAVSNSHTTGLDTHDALRLMGVIVANRMSPYLVPEEQREQEGADSSTGVGSGVSNRHSTGMDSHESWRKCDGCGSDWSASHCFSYDWCSTYEIWHDKRIGSCSSSTSMPTPSCAFYSPRIQGLYEGESTEFETATQHWTEVDSTHMEEVERIGEENNKYFNEVLMQHPEWGAFFRGFQDLKVGKKIGEGGQAEIFEATIDRDSIDLVAKVFKKEIPLKDLQQHWPPQMMSTATAKYYPCANVLGGAFIKDGEYKDRFAFVMCRRCGDLRTLIDQRILELLRNNKHGPPFSDWHIICHIISKVLMNLIHLHGSGVIHRDIKASNVLIAGVEGSLLIFLELMDFECCLGTLGTGFWRAPEILEQVQRRVPSHEVVFTKEADIYSFGMLCYEIITGLIPFEGHPQDDYSIVLSGDRPRLPDNLSVHLTELLHDCWQHDPRDRPSAQILRDKYKL